MADKLKIRPLHDRVIIKRLEEERKNGANEGGGTMANTNELPAPEASAPASKKP